MMGDDDQRNTRRRPIRPCPVQQNSRLVDHPMNVVCCHRLFRALLCGWIAAITLMVGTAGAESPKNVLMICVDDLKPNIGCFGDPVAVTPNIDALAQRGVSFQSAYCNQAVCAPSRNSLMTGLLPQTIGVYDLSTHFRDAAPDVVTVGEHFQRFGYQVQGLGKIYHTGHGNHDDKQTWTVPSWRPKGSQYVHPDSLANRVKDSRGRLRGPATEAADVPDDTYSDGKIADEAVRRLQQSASSPGQPFFLAVGFLKPHLPFIAPQKYWDLYDPQSLPMPVYRQAPQGAPEYAPTKWGELRSYSDVPNEGPLPKAMPRNLIHGYYAATSYIDAQIGKVLDELNRLQLADQTVVVLWGDHGWHLGDHDMWCKHTNYEQAARIPVVVAAPQGAKGQATESLIETVDIYPTLAELAGIDAPDGLDGRSFAAVVRDPKQTTRPFITHVYPRSGRLGRAIRTPRYRLVQWAAIKGGDQGVDLELYDYQNDPLETKNVAEENPKVVQELLKYFGRQSAPKQAWKP